LPLSSIQKINKSALEKLRKNIFMALDKRRKFNFAYLKELKFLNTICKSFFGNKS